jgi:hypothetical protein
MPGLGFTAGEKPHKFKIDRSRVRDSKETSN